MSQIANRLLFFCVLAVSALFCALLQLRGSLNPDVSWINYGTEQLLRGAARLYTDIVEVNPPFIYWLSAPPILIAHFLHTDASVVFVFWIVAIASGAIIFSQCLLWQTSRLPGFGLGAAVCSLVLIGVSFGQREHLVFLLFLPFVAMAILRASGEHPANWLCTLAGAGCGLAVALKPYYVFVPALLEAYNQLYAERPRPKFLRFENLAAIMCFVILFASAAAFHPEYFRAILPIATHAYFPVYHEQRGVVLFFFGLMAVLLVLSLAATWWNGFSAQSNVLLVAAFGCVIAYALQARGFAYQILPAVFFMVMLAADFAMRLNAKAMISGVVLAAGALYPLATFNSMTAYKDDFGHDIAEWTAGKSGHSVAVLSTSIAHAFPWVPVSGMKWTLRHPCLWFMPFVERIDQQRLVGDAVDATDAAIADDLRSTTVDDLILHKPDFLLLRTTPSTMFDVRFSYLDVLSRDPRFQPFFVHYRLDYENAEIRAYRRSD